LNKVFLGLGSNLGDRIKNLNRAIKLIDEKCGKVLSQSSFYETQPWGKTNQPDFINAAVLLESKLNAREVLKEIKNIELQLGRKRFEKWGERMIDIDILFFNDLIVEEEDLIIPHPFIQKRNFVLEPLAEIKPDFVHPVFKKSVSQLLSESKDDLIVQKIEKKLIGKG
jgi:2-amino-4-hydroxy-6-hydroxymethyldihydropteridine diphosphokinase